MASLRELIDFMDRELGIESQADFCPNGLQVEGREEVRRVLTGVTACQELFEAAAEEQADLVVVHHGIFWKGWEPRITGIMKRRIRFLLDCEISLAGYHLPLDRHPRLGNNAQIADRLGLAGREGFAPHAGLPVGMVGDLPEPMDATSFQGRLQELFDGPPLAFAFGPDRIRRVAVLSGKGDHDIQAAIDAGADAYITGEAGVSTREHAREAGAHFFACGHHATERWGIQALGELLQDHYGVPVEYRDVQNPV